MKTLIKNNNMKILSDLEKHFIVTLISGSVNLGLNTKWLWVESNKSDECSSSEFAHLAQWDWVFTCPGYQ